MTDVLRIKRRTGGGGAGAPTSLANAELAYNEMDDTLYYGKGTGGAGGSATTVLPIGGPGAFATSIRGMPIGGTTGQALTKVDGNDYNVAWTTVTATGGGAAVTVGDSAPSTPTVGQLWFESDTGNTFIWYADANSNQWVQINSSGAVQLPPPSDLVLSGTAPAGVSYVDADLWYGSRKSPPRWAWNDAQNGAGSDVAQLSETGNFSTTGTISAGSSVTAGGNVYANISFGGSSSAVVLGVAPGGTGGVYLRPNGTNNSVGQASVDSAGNLTIAGGMAVNLLPATNNTYNLGSATLRWATVYTSDLNLNNGVGDWTIVEGENDLFLYNNKKGKKYKFALIEVNE